MFERCFKQGRQEAFVKVRKQQLAKELYDSSVTSQRADDPTLSTAVYLMHSCSDFRFTLLLFATLQLFILVHFFDS